MKRFIVPMILCATGALSFGSLLFNELFSLQPAMAAHRNVEAFYQQQWCAAHNGRTEVILEDGSRADCVTETHAIEFDFDAKWAEAIGQSLHYADLTGKRGGIVLIGPDNHIDAKRVRQTIDHYRLPIDLWTVPE